MIEVDQFNYFNFTVFAVRIDCMMLIEALNLIHCMEAISGENCTSTQCYRVV